MNPTPATIARHVHTRDERLGDHVIAGHDVTDHAFRRMKQRDISRDEIEQTLLRPDTTWPNRDVPGGMCYMRGELFIATGPGFKSRRPAIETVLWKR